MRKITTTHMTQTMNSLVKMINNEVEWFGNKQLKGVE